MSSPLSERHDSLPALLDRRVSERGDAPLLCYRDETYTYREIDRRSNAIANGLADRGVDRGDRVCTFLYNSPAYLALWFGLSKLGAVMVPLNVSLQSRDLAYIVDDAEAETVVLEAETRENYESARADLETVSTEFLLGEETVDGYEAFAQLLDGDANSAPSGSSEPGEPASIIYTSGTTGLPKGVRLPHYSYVNTGAAFAERVDLAASDRIYTSLPLFHSASQQLAVMGTLAVGGDIAVARWFSTSSFWDDIRVHEATRFFYIGTMLQALLNQDERPDDDEHPAAYGMGAAAPEELVPEFEDRFGVELLDSYGLTEAGTLATFNAPGEANAIRDGSAGRPVEHIELGIVDDQDRPVPTGEVGEIVLRPTRPNAVMLDYHGAPETTVETWRNLWLHTGDMGCVGEDGYLYFVDRKAYTIRRRGENVSSRQVEEVLLGHPDVEEVAVVGVPGDLGSEGIKAVVKPGEKRPEPQELVEHCEGKLAPFKVPRYVAFTGEFPKTETERIEKYKLKEAGVGDAWDRDTSAE